MREHTYFEWAICINATIAGVEGEHIIADQCDLPYAQALHKQWSVNRPETNPRLVRRTVTVRKTPWKIIPTAVTAGDNEGSGDVDPTKPEITARERTRLFAEFLRRGRHRPEPTIHETPVELDEGR